jgi:hypothetical protein
MDEELDPTPEALVRCLQVLGEEAACLSLTRTFAALQEAISICRDESEGMPFGAGRSIPAAMLH